MNWELHEDRFAELASGYALCALTQAEARAFEAHLAEGCATCEAELHDYTHVLQALSFEADKVDPPSRLRDELLRRVSDDSESGTRDSLVVKKPDLLTIRADEGVWENTGNPGIQIKPLFVDEENGLVTTLMKLAPGAQFPMHRHRGIEQCFVVDGDVLAGGDTLGPGDFHVAMQSSVHAPLESIGGALLLLVSPAECELVI